LANGIIPRGRASLTNPTPQHQTTVRPQPTRIQGVAHVVVTTPRGIQRLAFLFDEEKKNPRSMKYAEGDGIILVHFTPYIAMVCHDILYRTERTNPCTKRRK